MTSALLLVLGVACAGDASQWAGTVTREGATVVVRNPADPLLPDGSVTAERLWAVPPDSSVAGAADVAWDAAQQIELVGDTVYALDPRLTRVHVVSPDGRWIRTFGRKGAGPGELQAPMLLVRFGDGLAVVDFGRMGLQRFATTGQPGDFIPLGGPVAHAYAEADGSVLVDVFQPGPGRSWRRVRPDGGVEAYAMPAGDGVSPAARTGARERREAARVVASRGDRFLSYVPAVPRLMVLDTGGAVVRRIELPGQAVQRSRAEQDSMGRRMGAMLARAGVDPDRAGRIGRTQGRSQRERTPYWGAGHDRTTGLFVLWEQGETSRPGAMGARLHLFSPEGVYLARVEFPEPWRTFVFVPGGLLASSVDGETGIARLVRYRLYLPPDALVRAGRVARRAGLD